MTDERVCLDLNCTIFQRQWFALENQEKLAIFHTLSKVSSLTWAQVYRDKGLRWKAVRSVSGTSGGRVYSIRVTQKFRALVLRLGNTMQFLSLHPDHDSAYN